MRQVGERGFIAELRCNRGLGTVAGVDNAEPWLRLLHSVCWYQCAKHVIVWLAHGVPPPAPCRPWARRWRCLQGWGPTTRMGTATATTTRRRTAQRSAGGGPCSGHGCQWRAIEGPVLAEGGAVPWRRCCGVLGRRCSAAMRMETAQGSKGGVSACTMSGTSATSSGGWATWPYRLTQGRHAEWSKLALAAWELGTNHKTERTSTASRLIRRKHLI